MNVDSGLDIKHEVSGADCARLRVGPGWYFQLLSLVDLDGLKIPGAWLEWSRPFWYTHS